MALVTVTFEWDDKYGPCYDCGRPSAYYVFNQHQHSIRVCSVDAAYRATFGDTIVSLDDDI